MKKLLSLVLAAAMLAAVSVPSFAAEINQDTADGKGVATVKTDTTNVPADGYFTVTYPAEMSVKWGAETTAFTYKCYVNSQDRQMSFRFCCFGGWQNEARYR